MSPDPDDYGVRRKAAANQLAQGAETMEPIRRILCPVDFSETSVHAFSFAERLALSLSAEILLLHVFDKAVSFTVAGQTTPADPDVARHLESVRPSSPASSVQRVLHVGDPGEVICWLAENQECDLIVMGTHGRRGLKHLVMGSVAEYVMRHARCPLMTVRFVPEKEPPLKEPMLLPVPAPRFM
jgi:universal stress protein A